MGKLHVSHRIVIRDENDRIVSDEPYDNFVEGKAAFDKCEAETGQEISLQHGARVVFKKGPEK